MASGIIPAPRFELEYYDSDTLSGWYIPKTGYPIYNIATTKTNATLRRVDRNIYYLYLALEGSFTQHESVNVGTFKFSFFDDHPVSGYFAAFVGGSSNNQWPATARIASSTGYLTITPSATANYCFLSGFFIRREDVTATN